MVNLHVSKGRRRKKKNSSVDFEIEEESESENVRANERTNEQYSAVQAVVSVATAELSNCSHGCLGLCGIEPPTYV